MTHLKLTDFATGLPVYVQREAIVSCRQVGPHHKTIASNVAIEYFQTRIDTEMDTFYVRETPEEIMEVASLSRAESKPLPTEPDALAMQGKTEPCCECGNEYPRADLLAGHIYCKRCRRSPEEVDRLQRSVIGCCDRHADNQSCGCMDIARSVHWRQSKRKH